MSDMDRRILERKMATDPDDSQAASRLANLENRTGEGRLAMLREFTGHWCYVEGARMNYVGILSAVTGTPAGDPAELIWSRLFRIGNWSRNGPDNDHCLELTIKEGLNQWIPWVAVDQFGLAPEGWADWIAKQ